MNLQARLHSFHSNALGYCLCFAGRSLSRTQEEGEENAGTGWGRNADAARPSRRGGEDRVEKQPEGWVGHAVPTFTHTLSFLPHNGPGRTFFPPFPRGNSGSEPTSPAGTAVSSGTELDAHGRVTDCGLALSRVPMWSVATLARRPKSQHLLSRVTSIKQIHPALVLSNVTFRLSFLLSERLPLWLSGEHVGWRGPGSP